VLQQGLLPDHACSAGGIQEQWVVQVFRRVRGFFFQVKAQRFDAWGYHHHLEGVVMVTSGVLGIWVKTLDLAVSTTTVHASLPS
jgi:hypothetical protein